MDVLFDGSNEDDQNNKNDPFNNGLDNYQATLI